MRLTRYNKSKFTAVESNNMKSKAVYCLKTVSNSARYMKNIYTLPLSVTVVLLFSSGRYPRLQQTYWHTVMLILEKIPL